MTIDRAGTPDIWVERSPELQELTGVLPFNAETPWKALTQSLLVPSELHFVRNHGAVPQLKWEDHQVKVKGLVDRERAFSMDELGSFPKHTVTVTMVCSGNRRKEVQMLRKSRGFPWGPTGVSTSHWGGVRVSDILNACGVRLHNSNKCYVHFRGPKGEVPLGDTTYGSAVDWWHCTNPADDVILAYELNGQQLPPDHGFPVRLVIPGYIGGRSIKWVSEITVADADSDNHYHVYDNRTLPTNVDVQEADDDDWWHRSETLTKDLNINSACLSPGVDEIVEIKPGTCVTAKGYAYTGGGKGIIRVEITLDKGKTWRQAALKSAGKANQYGKSFAGVNWEAEMQYKDLIRAEELRVRAWDDAMNTQPERLTWNLMGLMNNSQYVVKIMTMEPHTADDLVIVNKATHIRFIHPVNGGVPDGGWMASDLPDLHKWSPYHENWDELEAERAAGKTWVNLEVFSWDQIHKHNSEGSDCWFVRDGRIYDASSFIPEHPGGSASVMPYKGKDATRVFNHIHSPDARLVAVRWLIGRVKGSFGPAVQHKFDQYYYHDRDKGADDKMVALHPDSKASFPLISRESVSPDVIRFRFGLPSKEHRMGLPVGHHIFIYAKIDGETVVRPYTPISLDSEHGYFEVVAKIYLRSGNKPGGKMTTHLHGLKIGDQIQVKGPCGLFRYEGNGSYTYIGQQRKANHINLVAGGTGITPMLQVIKAIHAEKNDPTEFSLVFANRSEADIIMRKELEDWVRDDKRFKLCLCLSHPPEGWQGAIGHVNEAMLKDALWPAGMDTVTIMCGPPPLIKMACVPALRQLGYHDKEFVYL